ncbi:MAG: hypothetical protein AAF840_04960 [Bacteroidota bacterium]
MSKFLFSLSLILAALSLSAQSPLVVKTQAKGNAVRIRWVVNDPAVWLHANDNGYKVSRITIEANGQPLSVGAQGMSRVELRSTLKPRNESNWPTDELSQTGS